MNIYNQFIKKSKLFTDIVVDKYEKYFLEHFRYYSIKFQTNYRHNHSTQIFRSLFFGFFTYYVICSYLELANQVKYLKRYKILTEYSKLVQQIRGEDTEKDLQKVLVDIFAKSKQSQLSSMQILTLSEIVKKPELALHAQYLASLK